ncbi:TetR family transcriptional regulator [Mycobacteroides abscessus subsp. abscessus]|nr:TetR family transcriptional regulator [Mycobacteroides abscessus subsp. abscessus]
MDAAPLPEKTSAGIANLVRVIDGDPRIGTLMFGNNPANSVIAERRHAAWGRRAHAGRLGLRSAHAPGRRTRQGIDRAATARQAVATSRGVRSAAVFGTTATSAAVNSFVQQANSRVIPSGSKK